MKINRLSLTNFRQFYGHQEITFSTDPESPITLIIGDMGYGKSNIMNAICWTLWGDEPHLSMKSADAGELSEGYANTQALEENGIEQDLSIEVEVRLEDDEGTECIITRTGSARLDANGTINVSRPSVSMLYDDGSSHVVVDAEDIEDRIGQIIPKDLRHLFLFNGETIHQDVLEVGHLGTAVEHISQVAVLDRATKHIRSLITKERPQNPDEEEMIGIQKSIAERTEVLNLRRTELHGVEKELQQIEEEFEKQQEALGGAEIAEIEALKDKMSTCRAQRGELRTTLRHARERLHRETVNTGGIGLSKSLIEECLRYIENERMSGSFPPPIDREYLERLLANSQCICGTPLHENTESYEKIKQAIRDYDLPVYKKELDSAEPLLRRMLFKDPAKTISDLISEYEDARTQVERNRKHMERLEGELKKYPDFEINRIGVAIQNLRIREKRLTEKKANLSREVRDSSEEVSKLHRKKETLDQRSRRADRVKNRLYWLEEVANNLEQLRAKYMESVRSKLASTLRKNWGKLILKDESYDLIIDDYYRPAILDKHGRNRTVTRSKGELQTLGYAYTAALTEVADIRAPFIVDTPLGRIAKKPGANIARLLPKLLEGRQLVFLATDREYDSETKKAWCELIGRSYVLKHAKGATTVEAYET